jgi:hypothetical protein
MGNENPQAMQKYLSTTRLLKKQGRFSEVTAAHRRDRKLPTT